MTVRKVTYEDALHADLREANETIGFIVECCKQALKDCMHPRSIQAQHLENAIRRVDPNWRPSP